MKLSTIEQAEHVAKSYTRIAELCLLYRTHKENPEGILDMIIEEVLKTVGDIDNKY